MNAENRKCSCAVSWASDGRCAMQLRVVREARYSLDMREHGVAVRMKHDCWRLLARLG